MSTNLIQQLQQQLNYPELQKIDPNTQDVPEENKSKVNKLTQAILPAVLEGFYKLTRSKEGTSQFLGGNNSTTWAKTLFGDSAAELFSNIATYTGDGKEKIATQFQIAATEAANLIKNNAATDTSNTNNRTNTTQNNKAIDSIIAYMKEQRNEILHYLPATLQVGKLLGDNTIDDHTNKMDGPISGLMHTIEKAFSGTPGNDK